VWVDGHRHQTFSARPIASELNRNSIPAGLQRCLEITMFASLRLKCGASSNPYERDCRIYSVPREEIRGCSSLLCLERHHASNPRVRLMSAGWRKGHNSRRYEGSVFHDSTYGMIAGTGCAFDSWKMTR